MNAVDAVHDDVTRPLLWAHISYTELQIPPSNWVSNRLSMFAFRNRVVTSAHIIPHQVSSSKAASCKQIFCNLHFVTTI